jgi:hypothetical protein
VFNKVLGILAVVGFIGAPLFIFGVIAAVSLVSDIAGTPTSILVDPNGLTRREESAPSSSLVTANADEYGPDLLLVSLGIGVGALLWRCSRMLWQFKESTERAMRGLEAIAILLSVGVTAMLVVTFRGSHVFIYLIPIAAAMFIFAIPFIQYMLGQGKEKSVTQRSGSPPKDRAEKQRR